jgi:aspartate-semialdehyde dehydrogenase
MWVGRKPFEVADVKKLLAEAPGVVLQDDPENSVYPLAREAAGKDEVFVGRIRRDFSVDNGINMWVVADNIRKGAATNTVQIAEVLIKDYFIKWLTYGQFSHSMIVSTKR